MSKPVELIVARDIKYGIGLEGKIPWRCKEDMEHFKRVTTTTEDCTKKNAVIMGRRTWESLKNKQLVGRVNICLSSSPQRIATCETMKQAIEYANSNPIIEKIFIIGGERVYQEALKTLRIQTIWMTVIQREFPTDRDIRFIANYLKDYRNKLLEDNEEFLIWRYDLV